jgi:hypothetical protein
MIQLETIDKKIWNIDVAIINIIKQSTSINDKILIDFNNEGPCLRSCNFYNILDSICENFSIDKKRFVIQTSNNEEFHDEYPIQVTDNIWIIEAKKRNQLAEPKNDILQTVGCFTGQVNWARLAFVYWLDKCYNTQSIITCHYDNSVLTHRERLELRDTITELPDEIDLAIDFLKSCPRKLPELDLPYKTSNKSNLQQISRLSNFSKTYSEFFLELVCESYYSGLTFFPTEKTFRPIAQLTPFITFGPRGFLSNLHRCGFKTFSNYWSEEYDNMSGRERVLEIRKILSQLFKYTPEEIKSMYQDMLPILTHNKNRLMTITPEELKLG